MPRADLAWAIVRITFGLSLAYFHGYGKVFGGAARTAEFIARNGLPAPTVLAWCAALSEFLGGILLALGLATRWASLAIGTTMVVALYFHRNDAFERWELAMLYLAIAVAAFLMGGGRHSLDSRMRLRFPLEPKG